MVAYLRALEEMFNMPFPKGYIIHIPAKKPNKKGYKIIEVENTQAMFDLFLATKKVFDSENKDQPKVLTLPLEINKQSLTKV